MKMLSSAKIKFLYFLIDYAGITSAAFLCFYSTMPELFQMPLRYHKEFIIIFVWTVLLVVFLYHNNLLTTTRNWTMWKEIGLVFKSVAGSFVIMLSACFLFRISLPDWSVVNFFLMLFSYLSLWRILKRWFVWQMIQGGYNVLKGIVVGSQADAASLRKHLEKERYFGTKIAGYVTLNNNDNPADSEPADCFGELKDLTHIVRKRFIDEIFVYSGIEYDTMVWLIKKTQSLDKSLHIIGRNKRLDLLSDLKPNNIGELKFLSVHKRKKYTDSWVKNIFDMVVALMCLVVLSPLLVVIGIVVRIDSPGPAIYVQKRVGKKGRIFNLYKFRTMTEGADSMRESLRGLNEIKDGVMFKIRNDPRLTHAGKFLRKYHIDELPQLINVLKGEMSLVGPRPPLEEEVDKYKSSYMRRLDIKPGITGLSQLFFSGKSHIKRWCKYDFVYSEKASLFLDSKILWQTAVEFIKGNGC